jgi:hypothetical protein
MFSERYARLERRFQEQVESDHKDLTSGGGYVPNFTPSGSVDYVLGAMEPSTGVPGGHDGQVPEPPLNFSWSVEDFILHYCVRHYLCRSGESYHLTDLAKGGMTVRDAEHRRRERYERWYPLLQEELALLNKPGRTHLIAVGRVVGNFLSDKGLSDQVERVLQYSRAAAAHRNRAVQQWAEDFAEFRCGFDEEAFRASVPEVLADSPLAPYAACRPEGGRPFCVTESRMKLMFYYKNRFGELRNASRIVLRNL